MWKSDVKYIGNVSVVNWQSVKMRCRFFPIKQAVGLQVIQIRLL